MAEEEFGSKAERIDDLGDDSAFDYSDDFGDDSGSDDSDDSADSAESQDDETDGGNNSKTPKKILESAPYFTTLKQNVVFLMGAAMPVGDELICIKMLFQLCNNVISWLITDDGADNFPQRALIITTYLAAKNWLVEIHPEKDYGQEGGEFHNLILNTRRFSRCFKSRTTVENKIMKDLLTEFATAFKSEPDHSTILDITQRAIGMSLIHSRFASGFHAHDTTRMVEILSEISPPPLREHLANLAEILKEENKVQDDEKVNTREKYENYLVEQIEKHPKIIIPMRIKGHRFYIVFTNNGDDSYTATVINGGKGCKLAIKDFDEYARYVTPHNIPLPKKEMQAYISKLVQEVLHRKLTGEELKNLVCTKEVIESSQDHMKQIIGNCPIFNLNQALRFLLSWGKKDYVTYEQNVFKYTLASFDRYRNSFKDDVLYLPYLDEFRRGFMLMDLAASEFLQS